MKKIFFFDFDGVLVDSLKNMEISWNHVCKKFHLNYPFSDYKKQIGKPFNIILDNLGIHENQKSIKIEYENASLLHIDKISLIKNVDEIFKLINKKSLPTVLYTSKSFNRLNILLTKFDLKFSKIYCPGKGQYLKPDPSPIHIELENSKLNKEDALFIGDSKNDYLTSKNACIDYVNAAWGYEKLDNVESIFDIKDLSRYF
tara:strand:- start:227 stop:829 length:603 start_codon:yes stop_codon:yes gene_type:complete